MRGNKHHDGSIDCRHESGAGDRTRTGDLLLGKQTFYQLNYTRRHHGVYRLAAALPSMVVSLLIIATVALIGVPHASADAAPLKTISFSQETLSKGFTYSEPSGQFRLMVAGGSFATPSSVTVSRADAASLPAWGDMVRSSDAYTVSTTTAAGVPQFMKPLAFQFSVPRPGFVTWIGKLTADGLSWELLGSQLKSNAAVAMSADDKASFTVALFQSPTAQEGIATYYGTYTRKTKLTMVAASNTFPYGTSLKVTNLDNNKVVIVKVVDTGGFRYPTVIDLSTPSFARIQTTWKGVARVRVEIAKSGEKSTPVADEPAAAATSSVAPTSDGATPPTTAAVASIVVDVASGQRLAGKQYTKSFPIASLTKLMTAAVFLDTKPDLTKVVTYNATKCNTTCSCLRLVDGEQVTLKDLLYASLVGSANNATLALADATGMTRAEFVQKMNDKATTLGLTATNYVEPTGLDSGNVSSAADLAVMATVFPNSYPTIRKIASTGNYSFTSKNNVCSAAYKQKDGSCKHSFTTTDKLYGKTSFSIVTAKTGYIDESRHTFILRGKNAQGREVVVVLLKVYNKTDLFNHANALMNWTFAHYAWA